MTFGRILQVFAQNPTMIDEQFIRHEAEARNVDAGLIDHHVESFRLNWAGPGGHLDSRILNAIGNVSLRSPHRYSNGLMRQSLTASSQGQ